MFPFTGWFGCFNGLFVGEGGFNGLGGFGWSNRAVWDFHWTRGFGVLVGWVGGLDSFNVQGGLGCFNAHDGFGCLSEVDGLVCFDVPGSLSASMAFLWGREGSMD